MRGRISTTFFAFVIVILAGLTFLYAAAYYRNNSSAMIDRETVAASLDDAVRWMERNQAEIMRDPNPMLWRMLRQSAALTADPRLERLLGEYDRLLATSEWPYKHLWRGLDYGRGEQTTSYDGDLERILPDYNIYIIYSASCNDSLAGTTIVQRQHETSFCASNHPFAPACVTHHLMGFRLQQQNECADAEELQAKVDKLATVIARQLTFDPRVLDVYLQRVLMLLDSNKAEMVKPVWVARVLQAQQADGGWSDFYPLWGDGKTPALGFHGTRLRYASPPSSFHPTAQGLWIMSILSHSGALDRMATH